MEWTPAIDPGAIIAKSVRPALNVLLSAFDYVADCRVDPWQLAVELPELLAKGASLVDIRWLILRGLAEHAREVTLEGEPERSFRPLAVTSFPTDTCLVLSAEGAQMLRAALRARQEPAACPACSTPLTNGVAPTAAHVRATPEWDEGRRELRCQGIVIKRYRVPAPNQESILALFQSSAWPDYVLDPLPRSGEVEPKQRLHETIKSLNRNHLRPLIKFHANGHGCQIHWSVIEAG
jgi:hypothetical protein